MYEFKFVKMQCANVACLKSKGKAQCLALDTMQKLNRAN